MIGNYSDALPQHGREQLGIGQASLTRFDTIVMGRRTYDPALQVGVTSPYPHLRSIVFSRSLSSTDPEVLITDADPVATIRALKDEDSPLDIYLAGGGQLAAASLPKIDEIIIKRYPVFIGSGIRPFGTDFAPKQFTMTKSIIFDLGNSITSFRPKTVQIGSRWLQRHGLLSSLVEPDTPRNHAPPGATKRLDATRRRPK